MRGAVRTAVLAGFLLLPMEPARALAWGCEGHEAVAILAERLLDRPTADRARSILSASESTLERFCDPITADALAHASTWADDYRAIDGSTAGWHFVNVPRAVGARAGNYRAYCAADNCVLDAIMAQYRRLTMEAGARVKADALRFIIHFVGDLHQPLHAITNGDRGGNCLPLTYRNRAPVEGDRQSFTPNLHTLWDAGLIRGVMDRQRLVDARALADYVAKQHPPRPAAPQQPTRERLVEWANESNELGRVEVYGRLPVNIPFEPPSTVRLSSCAENNEVGRRMAKYKLVIDARYERTAVPVILRQLSLAGNRLAGILKAAFA